MLQFQHVFRAFFFHKWCHLPWIMTSSIIPFPSILNIWRRGRLTALLLPSTKNPLTIAISFAILEQSRVILSQAGRARYIVICINPAFTKMIDRTEKPKIPSKFAKRGAQYNEFRCNVYHRPRKVQAKLNIQCIKQHVHMKCEHRAWIFTILQHPPFHRERTQQLKKKYIFTVTIATHCRAVDKLWGKKFASVHGWK